MLVQKTKQYAVEIIGRKVILRKSSRFYNWEDTNREMRKFWELLLHMGCINLSGWSPTYIKLCYANVNMLYFMLIFHYSYTTVSFLLNTVNFGTLC